MRLIDADKLILYLNDYALHEAPFRGERAEAYNAIKQCIEAVEEQPTAYDIDKVVVELNELDVKSITRYKNGNFGNFDGVEYYIKKRKAIEIVKQEGVYEAEQKLKEMESDSNDKN